MDLDRRRALRRLFISAGVLGCVLIAFALSGSIPNADEIRDWGDDLGVAALIAFVPLFVALSFVVALPVIAGATGLLFGTALGTPLAIVGITAAAVAQMACTRYLAGDHAGTLLPKRIRGLETFLERNGTVAVMEARIVPLLSYALVNYTAGVTRLRFSQMALGTVVGAAPKMFGYVALGGNLDDLGQPEAVIAIVLLVVLSLIGALVVRSQITAARA